MLRRTLLVLLVPLFVGCGSPEVSGDWSGEIDAGGGLVSVEVTLRMEGDGLLAGEISFPGDGDYDIPLTSITWSEPSRINFGLPEVLGEPTFDGVLTPDGGAIRGDFSQGGRTLPFELRRGRVPQPTKFDEVARAEVVQTVAERLAEGYVDEEMGNAIADGLRAALAEGRLLGELPSAAADELTLELRRLSADLHLRVEYTRGAPTSTFVGRPEPPPRAEPMPNPPSGIASHRVLQGNVGYIEMAHFGGSESSADEIDAVMSALNGVDALILDLRWSRGGGAFAVRYISTYLFDEPVHLASRVVRGDPTLAERWTFDSVPGPRMAAAPVLVLTSRATISAAESFAFGLRNVGRARLVGERTAGGGHFGNLVDVGHGFQMFLPWAKTVHPKTGEGWEAEGLTPDVEVPVEEALDVALELLAG